MSSYLQKKAEELNQKSLTTYQKNKLIEELAQENKILGNFEKVLKKTISSIKLKPVKITPKKKRKAKNQYIMEAMLSDLHYGKKSDVFDYEQARRRMRSFTDQLISKMAGLGPDKPKELILALLGDIIENAEMHGLESLRGCEGGNPVQVIMAITSLWEDLLLPVSVYCQKENIKLTTVCITGNHDRTSKEKTFHNPGEEHLTYVIYSALEMLSKSIKVKNTFIIPKEGYHIHKIFNEYVLYEHGNLFKNNEKSLEAHLTKRGEQFGHFIHFLRFGHYHSYLMIKLGRMICNLSLCGQDSYSRELGYTSPAGQVVNTYLKRRGKTSFCRSEIILVE